MVLRKMFLASAVRRSVLVCGIGCAAAMLPSLGAEEWPQWMGEGRDNVWDEDGIIREIPAAGLKVLWEAPVEVGYAGPAVAEGRVFVGSIVSDDNLQDANFNRGRVTGQERWQCLSADDGRQLWQYEYPVAYAISYPSGPRATPLVEGDSVYVLGAEGMLSCLAVGNGEVKWQVNLPEKYNTKPALWGYAAHPLIYKNLLITLAGGEGTHVVALDKATGEQVWAAGNAPEQGYSPPLLIKAGGVEQLIVMSPASIRSLDPATGRQYWDETYNATSGSIIMTPLVQGNRLLVGGYSNRNLLLELAPDKPAASVVFRDKSKAGISPVNVQPVLNDGVAYGLDGDGTFMAVDVSTGKRLWETGQPLAERPVQTGTVFLVKNRDRYLMFAETGEFMIGELSPEGLKMHGRDPILEPTNSAFGRPVVWSPPAFANGRGYLRNDKRLVCVELRATKY